MTALKRKIWTLMRGGSFKGYLRYTSGYPLTLTDCVPSPPVNISVSGNTVQDGTPSPDNPVEVRGVGERTANLFNLDAINNDIDITKSGDKLLLKGYACDTKLMPEQFLKITGLNPGDVVTTSHRVNIISGVGNYATGRIAFVVKSDGNKQWVLVDKSEVAKVSKIPEDFNNTNYTNMYIYGAAQGTRLAEMYDIQIIKGSYTVDTLPPYEPYGYRVPIKFSGKNLLNITGYEWELGSINGVPIYLDEPLYGYDGYFDEIRIDTATKNARLVQKIGVLSPPKATSIIATSNTNQTRFNISFGGNTPRVGSIDKCNIAPPAQSASESKPCTVNSGGNRAIYIWILNSYVGIADDDTNSVKIAKANTFLEQHNAKIYYQLATPVTTDISDKIDWDSIPKLWRGTVIATTDTTIEPSDIVAEYYADKPGGGEQ